MNLSTTKARIRIEVLGFSDPVMKYRQQLNKELWRYFASDDATKGRNLFLKPGENKRAELAGKSERAETGRCQHIFGGDSYS